MPAALSRAVGVLPPHERRFTGAFDNITILGKAGKTDGMDRWAVHRTFKLGD
jgi:hypothetical protein